MLGKGKGERGGGVNKKGGNIAAPEHAAKIQPAIMPYLQQKRPRKKGG